MLENMLLFLICVFLTLFVLMAIPWLIQNTIYKWLELIDFLKFQSWKR